MDNKPHYHIGWSLHLNAWTVIVSRAWYVRMLWIDPSWHGCMSFVAGAITPD